MIVALPSSPRMRRRAARAVVAVAAVAALAAFVALMPTAAPVREAPIADAAPSAPVVIEPKRVPLRPADRAAITEVVSRFIPAALDRKDGLEAWRLAAPELRADSTPEQWARGELPVYPFATSGKGYDHWRLTYSYEDLVGFDILLHPKPGSGSGPIAFSAEMQKVGGQWRVLAFTPVATFAPVGAPPKVYSERDMAPLTPIPAPAEARVDGDWALLVLGALAALVVGAAVGIPAFVALRNRRIERRYRAAV